MIKTAAVKGARLKEPSAECGPLGDLCTLAKPGIVAAVAFSGLTGMVLAAKGLPHPATAFPCVASLLLMAAGAAISNSVLDQGMDREMARLTQRSAALARLGSKTALAAACALTAAAAALSAALLNGTAVKLLLVAAASYTLFYSPLLKRSTHWAAVLGGVPGALPVLIGDAAVAAAPAPAGWSLFLIMLIWQPPHFWLLCLAHGDEYRKAGIPVLPLVKGERFAKVCIHLGIAALIPATLLLHYLGPCSAAYALGAFLLGSCYLLSCSYLVNSAGNYRAAFRGSIAYLLLLFTLIIIDLCL